jgi:glutamate/tyrosine decarboxylase-like PLP-dependent enzyme
MAIKIRAKWSSSLGDMSRKLKGTESAIFSGDCAHYSHEKVMIVVDILVRDMVRICHWMIS